LIIGGGTLRLDHKYQIAQAQADSCEAGTAMLACPLAQILAARVQGHHYEGDSDISHALSIFESPGRPYLQAMLLASDSVDSDIATALEVPEAVIHKFKEYFFDVSAFRDRLERFEYISKIGDYTERRLAQQASAWGYKIIAMQLTPNVGPTSVEMVGVIEKLLFDKIISPDDGATSIEGPKQTKSAVSDFRDIVTLKAKFDPAESQNSFMESLRIVFEAGTPIKDIASLDPASIVRG
jgi:hypothetical protein